jgi:DNA-binding MarR family transcriptional regulator
MSSPEFARKPLPPAAQAGPAVPTLIGALLRVPAQAIQRRLMAGLNDSGYSDLRLPHMAVLQYPGPNGDRPQELADRAGMSKQAMNQLLQSLERLGYVRRSDGGDGDDGRARRVHFTRRGQAAYLRMAELLVDIEAEWSGALGKERFGALKALLADVWKSGLIHKPRE